MSELIFFLIAMGASFGILGVRKYLYRSKKWYPIILLTYIFILVLLVYLFIPLSVPTFQIRLFIPGLILIYAGIGIFAWAYLYLGLLGTIGGASLGIKDELVTTGPYKYTRNPQYLGILAFLFGFSLLTGSLYIFLFSLLWVILFYILVIFEEKELEQEFGERYIKYKNKVPRFL